MADIVPSTSPQDDPESFDADDNPGAPQQRSARHRRRAHQGKKGSFWRELPILIVTALVLTILIQTFLARVYVIPSQSMELTLHGCAGCSNDRVLVDKVTYRFGDPESGDVVVFRGPDSWGEVEISSTRSDNPVVRWFQNLASAVGLAPPDERDFVKRVIATGGQTVQCCDASNRVMVDGKALDEPYVYWDPSRGSTQEEFAPVTVPTGHLWVMGDNRNNSSDSRSQGGGGEAGAIPVGNVIGKARVVVLPPSRWRGIGDHDPQASAMNAPVWQAGIPAGIGFAAAWPTLWLGRRLRRGMSSMRRRNRD